MAHIKARHCGEAQFEKPEAETVPTGDLIDGHKSMSAQSLEQPQRRALVKAGFREIAEPFLDRPGGQDFEKQYRTVEQAA